MSKTVAKTIVETLELAGIKRIYGVVGDSLNGLTAALTNQSSIDWIHVRHEEAAAFAAGAEAQLTGNLTVCAGSCGPGNLHLINGLYDSHRSGAPVLAIAAQIPSSEMGSQYFQETHPHILFKDCSYFCELVTSPEQMPRLLYLAMQTAISRRGVAVLTIPGDIMLAKAVNLNIPSLQINEPVITPSATELKDIAAILNASKKVTLFCGRGCAGATKEIFALCEKLKAPTVHSLRGKEYLEADNPYDVGMTGFIGFASGYYAMQDCDTLLVLGSSFPYRQFYPEHAHVIQVDINGEQLGRRTPIELGVTGDVKATIAALLPLITTKTEAEHLTKSLEHYKKSRHLHDTLAVGKPGKKPIYPQFLAKMINDTITEDAILSCDVGTPTVWAARYIKMNGKRRLLGSFNHGSMANALSQAIGAQATYPNRLIVALCGDGGFTMLMGDILTLIQQKLPVKIIVFNNGSLGFVSMEMKAAGMLDFGTDLTNPNFATMAQSIGLLGVRIEDPADLEAGLKQAFTHPGPALVDVVINNMELIIPPAITAEQVKGFGLFMLKALMNGQGDKAVELIKSNLWQIF